MRYRLSFTREGDADGPDIGELVLHTDTPLAYLLVRKDGYFGRESKHSGQFLTDEERNLADDLRVIDGFSSAEIGVDNCYEVVVQKGRMFRWADIIPAVLAAFEARFGEFKPVD